MERQFWFIIFFLFLGNSWGEKSTKQITKIKSGFSSSGLELSEKIEKDFPLPLTWASKKTSSKTNYVITHPSSVTHEGNFLSHHVTRFTQPPFAEKSRRRREVEHAVDEDENIYFALDVEDRTLMLNMSENHGLFHPNFVVERFQKDPKKERNKFNPSSPDQSSSLRRGTRWNCHFRGHVIGNPNSSVALSTCIGLTGLIRLDDVDYFIEPLMPSSTKAHSRPQPHKIYKRDATIGSLPDDDNTSSLNRQWSIKESIENARSHVNTAEETFDVDPKGESFRRKKFCGVTDTKRRYRRNLRRRKVWESRHASKSRSRAKRKRRSLSLEHWIEMMVVVDHEMVKYHQADNVERYVLTVINMVSELFRDVSIGNLLHVTLIRLIILDEEEENLKITSHAEKTLDGFCRWSKRMNPQNDQHANHHDVAVLLTRHNLCANSNKSCETLGLAHVAGMCQPHRSCNVNQDTGLSLAFTVAHELGHNRNWGFCLLDLPAPDHDHYNLPVDLPGALYDADHQCRFAFGPQSRQCVKVEEHMCVRLWCLYKGTCRTRLHSAVPGTKCAPGKWCQGGSCVGIQNKPSPVDGSWGPWTQWTRCSRTCGVGVTQSARYCNQPSPRFGGKYCLGERRKHRTCNVWSCTKTSKSVSFRTEQCAEFNKIPYKNNTYTWLPVDSPVYPCELHCYTRDTEHPFADRLGDKVVDGTRCFSHGKDICVDGICKRLGCDFQIDSLAMEDRCGVCRGDGTSCSEVNSTFNLPVGDEYVAVGMIPKGARRIEVTEVAPSRNFLALRSASNESEFYLNGNYKIQWDFQFDLAGTVFNYKRINKSLDNITAEGPVSEDVVVMLLFVEENPGVEISYIMPHNVTAVFENQHPDFKWKMQPWSACSRTCGKGMDMSLAVCTERKAGIVDEDFCDHETRPKDEKRICANPDCPPEWFVGAWQPCSVTCGGGSGRQKRTVLCVRSMSDDEQIVLNQTECNEVLQPENMRSCSANNQQPCPMWRVFEWENCSQPCGHGYRNRSIKCVTYAITDVITVEHDVANVEDDVSDVELDSENLIPRKSTRGNKISKFIIVERPSEKNLMENLDFEIEEEEEKCNPETRPDDMEPCDNQPCQSGSSSDGSGVDESTNSVPQDPLIGVRIKNKTDSTSRDLDFDVEIAHDMVSGFDQENGSSSESHYKELLDVKTLSGMDAGSKQTELVLRNDSESSSGEDLIPTAINVTVTTTTTVSRTLPPRWLTGIWGQCSTTCGIGAQIRNVVCNAGPGFCDKLPQPAPAKRCHAKPCAEWTYAGWTKCSRMCGEGRKRRKVQCRSSHSNKLLPRSLCEWVAKLPRVNSSCNIRECLPWRTSRWSTCNVFCGMGVQRRRVGCLKRGMCDPTKRPVGQKNCRLRTCAEWRALHWGRCPVNCGYGLKRRVVKCVERESGANSRACNPKLAPTKVKKCNKGPCRVTDFDFSSCNGDRLKLQFCSVLKKWGKCVQPSLAIQCCRTCKTYINVRQKNKIS